MNLTAKKLGRAAAAAALCALLAYTVCFAAVLFVNKPFVWTGLQQFVDYETASVTVFKYAGMGCMMVYACAFLVQTLCVREWIPRDRRLYGTAASAFAIAFCVCVCAAYFVQMSSTRLQIRAGNLDGLIQFTQSYSLSAINGINMLGWTFFYGASSFALGMAIAPGAAPLARGSCLLNAAVMFAGLAGYMLNHVLLLVLTMNLGLGGAGILMAAGFLRLCKKTEIR